MVYKVCHKKANHKKATHKKLCLKKKNQTDVVEFLTEKMLVDTLPSVMSDEATFLYNRMRHMEPGDTFQYEDFEIKRI